MQRFTSVLLAVFALLAYQSAAAELPDPRDIHTIAVKPHPHQLPEHFTPASLRDALPRMKRVYMRVPIGGKIWWQSGVIVLRSGEVIFWRTFRPDFIAVETEGRSVFYAIVDETDRRSTTRSGDGVAGEAILGDAVDAHRQ